MTTPKRVYLRFINLSWLVLSVWYSAVSQELHVGPGQPYASLEEAAADVVPGESIIIHEGTYPGGVFINALQGLPGAWITIMEAPEEEVIFKGGTNAWQLTDAAYVRISGFTFQHQTGNGLNLDDGGSYETPAHHIVIEHCEFLDMDASGNNDMLKLSGVDSFEVRSCVFINGAAGGSGIDMVGCHDSSIHECHFENQGSNSIQAKGGSSQIRIERNYFKNGGLRTLNLGGSTGLQFFLPLDAPYEAADIKVYSNIIVGTDAPVAFVGTINTEVVNNTIYLPSKWVMRILQETVDTSRFPPCGYNTFRNNIIYIDDRVSVECNIGPNTAPETFTMSNNLWFHSTQPGWSGPELPVSESNAIIGEDPLFEAPENELFSLLETSPAIGSGMNVADPETDYTNIPFLNPRTIGAFEGGVFTGIFPSEPDVQMTLQLFPNPADHLVKMVLPDKYAAADIQMVAIDGTGQILPFHPSNCGDGVACMKIPEHYHGMYLVSLKQNGVTHSGVLFVQ